MKHGLLRFAVVSLAGMLLVAIAAAWLLPPLLDWSQYRTQISTLVTENIGHPVSIDGPISLQLLPEPIITASRVSISEAQNGVGVTVAALRLRLGLPALLSGRIDARELVLGGLAVKLPWPLAADHFSMRPPAWLSSISARVEDGKLSIGAVTSTAINVNLGLLADTGSYSASGTAVIAGQPWHLSARLTQPGHDGAAGLDLALDGLEHVTGLGGLFSGQISRDGVLAGRISASGPDLSRLLAAPAVAFKANGRLSMSEGLAVADQLAVDIAGSPARGAVSLRLRPSVHLDVSLAASRLNLDQWLPALLGPPSGQLITAIPIGIDLSAEAATLAGGLLRELRGTFEIAPDSVSLRDVAVVLPGDAPFSLAGDIQRVPAQKSLHFAGRATLAAPHLRTTLGWLEPQGFGALAALPPDVLRSADLRSAVTVDAIQGVPASLHVGLSDFNGLIDTSHVQGDLTLLPQARLGIAGSLKVDQVELDPWLSANTGGLLGLPSRLGPYNLDLQIRAEQANLQGHRLAPLTLNVGLEPNLLTIRRLETQNDNIRLLLSGSVSDAGQIGDGQVELTSATDAAQAALADWVPPLTPFSQHLPRGPLAMKLLASGAPDALSLLATLDLADLHIEAQPVFNLLTQHWTSKLSLRHPGAPRLLDMIGYGSTAAWLGDGSLSWTGNIAGDGPLGSPSHIASDHFDATAGSLRASGNLAFDFPEDDQPRMSGRISAETLPLPLPAPHSPTPLPIGWLTGWQASVQLDADQVLAGQSAILQQGHALVALGGGLLQIENITGKLDDGAMSGGITLNAAMSPPNLGVDFAVVGAKPTAALFDLPLDLEGGVLDGAAELNATGYAPATLLATLTGSVQMHVQNGALIGFELQHMGPRLSQADVDAALSGGSTPFDQFDLAATFKNGALTLDQTQMQAASGSAVVSGLIDLTGQTTALRAAIYPAVSDPPELALRLNGALANPTRIPESSDALRWRAEHPSAKSLAAP